MRRALIFLVGCGSTPASPTDAGTDAQQEGGAADTGAPIDSGGLSGKRVFVSSQTFDGAAIKSTTDADKACQVMAKNAGYPGFWLAWISDGAASSPATRFGAPFQGPYVLAFKPSVQIVAGPGLFAKKLDHAIDVDENGVERAGFAWTQTDPNGDFLPSGVVTGTACNQWTTTSSTAMSGSITSTSTSWTFDSTQTCDKMGRIYCFEQ